MLNGNQSVSWYRSETMIPSQSCFVRIYKPWRAVRPVCTRLCMWTDETWVCISHLNQESLNLIQISVFKGPHQLLIPHVTWKHRHTHTHTHSIIGLRSYTGSRLRYGCYFMSPECLTTVWSVSAVHSPDCVCFSGLTESLCLNTDGIRLNCSFQRHELPLSD